MPDPKPFMVPQTTDEDREKVYKSLADFANTIVPPPGKRIYSISFVHNGDRWTATVGETLSGEKRVTSGRGRSQTVRYVPTSDDAKVLAIFPGHPYIIVTDAHPVTGNRSSWANPFYTSHVTSETLFD